jgi:hypothetical protein
MKVRASLVVAVALMSALPLSAGAKKKNQQQRAMLEKMEAVPCGANQKGLSGLGSFWASVGVTDVHSNEKRCPEYLLRTDDMDYRVRPMNMKHPEVLPIGHEVVFKIAKDRMMVGVPDGDKKMRSYEVVSMEPAGNSSHDNASARSDKP